MIIVSQKLHKKQSDLSYFISNYMKKKNQMHDLIFMYQPKPPLSLQRKGKEKKRNMLTTGYSATSISRAFAELMSP